MNKQGKYSDIHVENIQTPIATQAARLHTESAPNPDNEIIPGRYSPILSTSSLTRLCHVTQSNSLLSVAQSVYGNHPFSIPFLL
jgi:hypothetical protein